MPCDEGTTTPEQVLQYGLVHISVGDLLREQVADGTAAGLKAKDFMESGNLVPDEVVVEMVVSRLSQDDAQTSGWLLDGYPRSSSQAEAIVKENIVPDIFLLINVPDEVIVERVVGRRLDPQTGAIYHLKYKPPPASIESRLVQVRSIVAIRSINVVVVLRGMASCPCMRCCSCQCVLICQWPRLVRRLGPVAPPCTIDVARLVCCWPLGAWLRKASTAACG
jgi:adenylate kinase family enzyme